MMTEKCQKGEKKTNEEINEKNCNVLYNVHMNLSPAFQDQNPPEFAKGNSDGKKYEMVCLQKLLDSLERKICIYFWFPLRNFAFAHT